MRNIQRCQSTSEILVRWHCPQCGLELKTHIDVFGGITILDKPHTGYISAKKCLIEVFEITYHQDVTVEAILPALSPALSNEVEHARNPCDIEVTT